MLAPDDRNVLLEQLKAPTGFQLDAAVATTFTLDLAAALVPPLAFAAFEAGSTPDPISMMQAVRACTDRVDIFCQAGQISIPGQASDLMAFLEPMVHEVRQPRPGHLFHPKIWMLRYVCEDELAFRFLCLSRNLTNDHSWDVTLRLDGQLGRISANNRPIADLLKALPGLCRTPLPPHRHDRLLEVAEQARRIEWDPIDDVKDIRFHTFGIGTRQGADFSGYRHLIVSPFLNDKGLDFLAGASPDVSVVSRIEALDGLGVDKAAGIDSYIVSALAGLDTEETSEGSQDPAGPPQGALAGLHAKVYVIERNRNAHVFVGSANATDAAFNGNVEILVELVGGATKLGVNRFLAEDAPFRGLLESYEAVGLPEGKRTEDPRWVLENLIRKLAAVPIRAVVAPEADADTYTVSLKSVRSLDVDEGFSATMELLTRPGNAHPVEPGALLDARTAGVVLADVTPFVALRATSPDGLQGGTVLRAELVDDPPGRLDEVLARQVDTPEKLMRFIALLLGLIGVGSFVGLGELGNNDAGGPFRFNGGQPGFFELVLRGLASRPQALRDIDRLLKQLNSRPAGRAVIPAGLEELWPLITATLNALDSSETGA